MPLFCHVFMTMTQLLFCFFIGVVVSLCLRRLLQPIRTESRVPTFMLNEAILHHHHYRQLHHFDYFRKTYQRGIALGTLKGRVYCFRYVRRHNKLSLNLESNNMSFK